MSTKRKAQGRDRRRRLHGPGPRPIGAGRRRADRRRGRIEPGARRGGGRGSRSRAWLRDAGRPAGRRHRPGPRLYAEQHAPRGHPAGARRGQARRLREAAGHVCADATGSAGCGARGRPGRAPCRSSTATTRWCASCAPGSPQGRPGRSPACTARYLQDWLAGANDQNWRVDDATGGPSRTFADIGSHWCDLTEFVTGDRIAASARRLGRFARRAAAYRSTDRRSGDGTVPYCGRCRRDDRRQPGRGRSEEPPVPGGLRDRVELRLRPGGPGPAVGRAAYRQPVADPRPRDAQPAARRASNRLPAGHAQGYQDAFDSFVADTYAAALDGDQPGRPAGLRGRCPVRPSRRRRTALGRSRRRLDHCRKLRSPHMPRPITLFTGQWADLPFEEVCQSRLVVGVRRRRDRLLR